MTLAVGVFCPWEPFAERQRRLGLAVDEFVVLASDSRWRTPLGVRYQPQHDSGKKLYRVGTNAAAVFSGDVVAGHDGIGLLERELRRNPSRSLDAVENLAQEALARVYKRERRKRNTKCGSLHCLLAMGNGTEGVRLVYCGSENGFAPTFGAEVQIWGNEDAGKVFRETLDRGLDRWYEQGEAVIEPTSWGIAVSASLDAAVQRVGGTVGGKVQLGIVSRTGFAPLRIVSLDTVATPPADDVWRDITFSGRLEERPVTH